MIFGLASLASAFAPSMAFLIACRFVMGVGLGAENVVGYSTLTEFSPPQVRGRQQGIMAVFVVTGLPVSALTGLLLVPLLGWRVMFVLGGLGAIGVWYARKRLPESPRWLAANGHDAEAEALLRSIEAEVEAEKGPLPPPSGSPQAFSRSLSSLFAPALLPRKNSIRSRENPAGGRRPNPSCRSSAPKDGPTAAIQAVRGSIHTGAAERTKVDVGESK